MHKRGYLIVFICLSLFYSTYSQGIYPMGSRSMAMANASVTNVDVWAYHNNPAALSSLKEIKLGISYENRFLTKEMQSQGFAFSIPVKNGVMSIGGQGFGYSQLRTYKAGIGYSKNLTEFISVGLQFNYQTIRINPVYGNSHGVSVETGFLTQINEKTKFGVSIFNIGRTISSKNQEDRFSTCMRMGVGYQLSSEVLYNVEFEKNVINSLRFKNGIEYKTNNHLYLRGGFSTYPIELSFGFAFHPSQNFSLNSGFSYLNSLGWSPNLSFEYGF